MSENRNLLQEQAARIAELEETVRRKQALAEERQELINTWQAEKEQALAELAAAKQETARVRDALQTAEKRLQGYEMQFERLQQAAAKAEAMYQQAAEAESQPRLQMQARQGWSLVQALRNKLKK